MATKAKGSGAAAGDIVHFKGEDYTVTGFNARGHMTLDSPKRDGKRNTLTLNPAELKRLDDVEGAITLEMLGAIRRGNAEERVAAVAAEARKALGGRRRPVYYLPGRLLRPANAEE